MGSALVYTTFDRHRNQQHIVVSGNEDAMKKIPSLASSFPKCSDLETSDDSRSLKRKSMSLNEEGAGGGTTTVPIVTVDLGSLSREQKRELRKRLKLNLDQVKSIAAKIDVREEYLLSTKSQVCVPDARVNACNSDAHLSRTDNNGSTAAGKEVTSVASELPSTSAEDFTTTTRGDTTPPPPPPADMTEREARLARQPSIIVTTEGDVGTPGGTQGKEKRTPKANQLYLNSEFVSGKDKMPPAEKLKPKGSTPGVKRGGGAQGKFDVREGKRQKVEAARAKRMADILRQCSTLLKRIMSHKHAWVFNEPVDAEKLGLHDYHKVINKPMDLGTVKERIANGFYSSPISFADDVRLTFANAMTYNPQGHDVYVMAQVLLGLFNDRWKDIARKLEEENLKIKVEEETLAFDDSTTMGQTNNSLHDLHEHLKRVETQIQSLAKSRPSPAVRSSAQAKPRPDDVEKRPMTFEEKRKLSVNLESLPGDKLERIVQIIKKRNPEVGQNEDEIEVDIDSFDNDTLWELDRFITNCMKSRGKKAKKANQKAQHGFSEAPQVDFVTLSHLLFLAVSFLWSSSFCCIVISLFTWDLSLTLAYKLVAHIDWRKVLSFIVSTLLLLWFALEWE